MILGTYGRLIKVTPDYLAIVESLLRRHPGITFAIGGSGDPAPVRRFIAERGLEKRIHLFDGYVDGHLWGHALDVFLDTFPLHGGASCREVIAKGGPVVSLHDEDMPNLSEDERIPTLVARSLAGYEAIVSRLVDDRAFLEAARQQTRQFARSRPNKRDYATSADRVLRTLARRHDRDRAVAWLKSLGPVRWRRADRLL